MFDSFLEIAQSKKKDTKNNVKSVMIATGELMLGYGNDDSGFCYTEMYLGGYINTNIDKIPPWKLQLILYI